MKKTLLLTFTAFILMAMSADHPAYLLFNKKGKQVKYSKMIAELQEADVILFGELHNNSLCHWLELEVAKSLLGTPDKQLVIGAEMFEADNQLLLDEYLSGTIKTNNFEAEAKLWQNYGTDYKPLVEFCKTNGLKFVGANVPRRYASMVSKKGLASLDSLSDEAKKYIAPLPLEIDLELPGYKNMIAMMGGHGTGFSANNIAYAQGVKDATMAHFILKNLKKNTILLHYNGSYHSNNFDGIYWHLKNANPDLKIKTITTVEIEDILSPSEDDLKSADYIFCIPENMTKTYTSKF
ncbi:ChaN family lipoprotein [Flammeovirgaceae bacterium SG7u.111]|nr:ChaN family lipoprotein [Flammeovirgaceae bacterium SG7u.132]WPO37790.1 ChaN family lipoprotein [Flammeovirgaceae bacterium SG7u.111]